ncbi:MAG: carboxymuconolactone decarboxylase family protein [Magnetovibrionaceae bacterium]
MPLLPSLPDDALVKDVYPLNPSSFRHWCYVEEAIMRGPSAFTPGERELMGAFVSKLNSCTYCYSSHSEAAVQLGVERDVIDPLMADIESAPIKENLKPVFRFLKKLTETPYKMTQGDADAVYGAGWDEKALHDAIMVCCCYSFMNRLADGHGLPSDPSLFEMRGKRHAEEGYLSQYLAETEGD